MVVGVNGVGKTTTIGKLAWHFKKAGKRFYWVQLIPSGQLRLTSFPFGQNGLVFPLSNNRWASILHRWPLIQLHQPKQDNADVVIVDTAGRLHNKANLMNELSKIKRVIQKVIPDAPHEVLLVLDGSTGQNAFEQARQFTEATQVNALAITKLDGTAKGGVVIGISDQFKIPVKYIGIGEKLEDLQLFDKTHLLKRFLVPAIS